MERYCSTGQSPQRAVAPIEVEEKEVKYLQEWKPPRQGNGGKKRSFLRRVLDMRVDTQLLSETDAALQAEMPIFENFLLTTQKQDE